MFVLVDIRHLPQKIDLEFIEWCGENQISFSIIFTKSDKMKTQATAEKSVAEYKKILLESWEELPNIFVTSAEKKLGGEQILDFIEETNKIISAK